MLRKTLSVFLVVVLSVYPSVVVNAQERSRPEIDIMAWATPEQISWDVSTKAEGYLGRATVRREQALVTVLLEAPGSPPAELRSGPGGTEISYAGQTVIFEEGGTVPVDAALSRLATVAMEQADEMRGAALAAIAVTSDWYDTYEIDMGWGDDPYQLRGDCHGKTAWCVMNIAFDIFSIWLLAGACAAAAVTGGVMTPGCIAAIVGHTMAATSVVMTCNEADNACTKWSNWKSAHPGW